MLFDTLKTDVQVAVADGGFTLGLQAKASNLADGSPALISASVSVVESTLIAIVVPPTAVPTGDPIVVIRVQILQRIRLQIPVVIRVQILQRILLLIPVMIQY